MDDAYFFCAIFKANMQIAAIIKQVKILTGAPGELVTHRDMRTKYCTNRSIKTWATYFLLKSITDSGTIQQWTSQQPYLLSYCKMSENCFRARLRELQDLKLITLTKNRSILLTSFETAAEILGIEFTGLTTIDYDVQLEGNQIFQYFLRAEEVRCNQHKQLTTLWYYVNKNPLVKDAYHTLLIKEGCDAKLLAKDLTYFQQELLKLQCRYFHDGSPLLDIVTTLRADINRGVQRIKEHHCYKAAQSVSYMKKRMVKLQLITVQKVTTKSATRARLYISAGGSKAAVSGSSPLQGIGPRRQDGYKYLPATKETAWILTDQVTIKFQSAKQAKNAKKKVAA
jgi:hypothetical protein